MSSSDPLLARNWRKSKVLTCHDKQERLGLVCFLRERYDERFFEPIRILGESSTTERGYGFAIMSLCCLLIETLQCYRLGWPSSHWKDLKSLPVVTLPEPYYEIGKPVDSSNYSSEIVFKEFFVEPEHTAHFPEMKGKGEVFYKDIRCGLLHQAQTKHSWRITMSGKSWEDAPNMKTINRNKFWRSLKNCFDALLEELENGQWNDEPWRSVRKKIWWLVQTS
ncbi:MAG: hypothetical protein WA020_05920 [Candidatus Acidiferrales bacterium]